MRFAHHLLPQSNFAAHAAIIAGRTQNMRPRVVIAQDCVIATGGTIRPPARQIEDYARSPEVSIELSVNFQTLRQA